MSKQDEPALVRDQSGAGTGPVTLMNRISVLCIGNALVADDAFGPRLYDHFCGRPDWPHVSFRLLGVGGLDLLSEFEGQDLAIVVDAVNTGSVPGTLKVVPWQEIEKVDGAPVTSHDIGLDEVMKIGRLLHPELMPREVVFVGVEGQDFNSVGGPLSRAVEQAFPLAVQRVEELIAQYSTGGGVK